MADDNGTTTGHGGPNAEEILTELLRLMRARPTDATDRPSEAEGRAIADYLVLRSLLRGTRGDAASTLDATVFAFDAAKHTITLDTSFGVTTADVHLLRAAKGAPPASGTPSETVRLAIAQGDTIAAPKDTHDVLRVDLLDPNGEIKGWARPK